MSQIAAMKMADQEVSLDKLREDPALSFRKDEGDIDGLAKSIDTIGLINPITVQAQEDGTYIILAGRRRKKAVEKLGWGTIPARVIPADAAGIVQWGITAAENCGRKDLDPIEEAGMLKQAVGLGLKQKEIAEILNRSQPYVANRIRLLTLPDQIQDMIKEDKLQPAHAEHALLKLNKWPEEQLDLAKQLQDRSYGLREAGRVADSIVQRETLMEDFRNAVDKSKYKVCPKCGKPPRSPGYSWKPPIVDCSGPDYHRWNLETGRVTIPSWVRESYAEKKGAKEGVKAPPRVIRSTVTIEKMARVLTHRARQLPQYLHVIAKELDVDFPERMGATAMNIRYSAGPKSGSSSWGWDLGAKGFSIRCEPKKYQDPEGHCTKIEIHASEPKEVEKQTHNILEWLEGVEQEADMLDQLAQKGVALTIDVQNPFVKPKKE